MSLKHRSVCLPFTFIISALLIFQPFTLLAQFSNLDQVLTRNKKMLGNDFTLVVVKDGKIAWKKETNSEFTLKTVAPIGATSSWLTAALVMTFVNEGKIRLDDPVTKYIPIFGSYSKRYITIRNCLAHTTGIQADPPTARGMLKNKYSSLEELVNSFAKREIEKNPGEMYYFSNVGPSIAGRICEIVSKKGFDRLMAERILRPLKMRGTNFYIDYSQAMDPFGGATSTANDFANFLSMLLAGGTFEGKKILTPESIAEMQKMQIGAALPKYTPALAQGYEQGLGVFVMDKDMKGATVVSAPGIFGPWAMVDYSRGYGLFLITKEFTAEQKKDLYDAIRAAAEAELPANTQ